MKKAIIIAALAFVSLANAQKGSVLVAGNIGYVSQNTGDLKSNYFEFAPKVGYQFSDNMTVGIETAIGNSTDSDRTGNVIAEYKRNDFQLGAFLRYSQPLAGVFSIFGDLGVGMQSTKLSNNLPFSNDVKGDGFYIGLVPAVGVDLKKGFCLNFSIGGLGYDSLKYDGASDATNTFAFTFGKQASIGISKNF
jgi:hypothetical protein